MSHYSIYVLEYAYIPEFPKSAVIYAAHNAGTVKLPFSYVVVKGQGRVIMIDVGHDNVAYGKVLTEKFGIENWRSYEEVLGECGVAPEDVTDIIVTHAHFDHMGGLVRFPNAKVYIQEQELAKWIWIMSLDDRFQYLMGATDPADILRAVDIARQGRLVSLQGAREDLLPYIDVYPAFDTHTAGSQYVVIRNDGAKDSSDAWVLAGDLLYQFENAEGMSSEDKAYRPVGLAYGSQTNLLFITAEMAGRAKGDLTRLIPIHEERLKDRFPSRKSDKGLQIIEIALGEGQTSVVTN